MDNSGSAFPLTDDAISPHRLHDMSGLTRREWFAGRAPECPDNFSYPPLDKAYEKTPFDCPEISKLRIARLAAWAFVYADAMIKESQK